MANTAGHGKKNFPVALSPRCAYIYLYEPLKKNIHTQLGSKTREWGLPGRTIRPSGRSGAVGPAATGSSDSPLRRLLHRRAALVDARVSPSLNAPHIAVVIVAAIFSLFLLVFFFFGDNFAARPPLDSFDQFDGGRFLATRESIGGHRLVQLSTLSAKKKWRNGWERRNNYGNDALFHLVVSSFAAFWLHCHVAFFHPKGIRR